MFDVCSYVQLFTSGVLRKGQSICLGTCIYGPFGSIVLAAISNVAYTYQVTLLASATAHVASLALLALLTLHRTAIDPMSASDYTKRLCARH